jgi:hypothetical protein
MAAPVGAELAKQPVPLDHLGQTAKARLGALLRDEKGRADRARRVIKGDHQVKLPLLSGQPGKARSVLVQHHPRHRPPRPLLAMSRAPGRRLCQTRSL